MARTGTPALIVDGDQDRLVATLFVARALASGLTHVRNAEWRTDVEPDPLRLGAVASEIERSGAVQLLLEIGSALALVRVRRGDLRAEVAAVDDTAFRVAIDELRALLPQAGPADAREIDVTFWHRTSYGAYDHELRTLTVPSWDDVAVNYPVATRRQLARLVDGWPDQGRLLLWHGAPGTGKTFALRALGWEWRRWCAVHYVIDPEILFGEDPGYLIEVVTHEESHGRDRLLVLEDTGELLSADARERTGQGLSRLLNLADGLLGDGLRVFVLVTTNEPLRRLHEAVSRPGRCAEETEFLAFSEDEAAIWSAENGMSDAARAGTLAELFASRRGSARPSGSGRSIGFAG